MIEDEKEYKIIFLGDSGVGKTSLINRFVHENFKPSQEATLGVMYLSKKLIIDKTEYTLQVNQPA